MPAVRLQNHSALCYYVDAFESGSLRVAQIARELAERRLDAEQRKFILGASAIRFVLDEQQNVTQAQTNEIRALVDYAKAIVNYDRAIGRTLERNNIQIEQELRPSVASAEAGGIAGL